MTTKHSARNTTFLPAVPILAIAPSPLNPRQHFDEAGLQELAESLKAHGLLEPLVVRRLADGYEIIAGERRWRAAQLAGLAELSVQVLDDVDDAAALRLMLVENLQRQDLDPIDEADGYRRLNVELGLKQREIADAVNRSQPAVANRMRLLELPADVQERIRSGELSPAHGVALARFKDFPPIASALATMAVAGHWGTRELEQKLPGRWELMQKGLIVQVYQGNIGGVGTSVCESCPFNAYRSEDDGYYKFCLKPEHHRELVARAEAEAARKAQECAEQAAASGGTLPKLADLPRDGWDWCSESVKACTSECPCRKQAIDFSGNVVGICMDPARFKRLKAEQTKADTKAKRAEHKALREQLVKAVDGIERIGIAELAILATAALCHVSRTGATKEAARHAAGLVDFEKFARYELREKFKELARLPEAKLVRFVVEAVLRDELSNRFEGYASSSPMIEWYLGPSQPAAPSGPNLLEIFGDEPSPDGPAVAIAAGDVAAEYGLPPALLEADFWNSIAFAAQSGGRFAHHAKPAYLDADGQVKAEIGALVHTVAARYGYTIGSLDVHYGTIVGAVSPAVWPPPKDPTAGVAATAGIAAAEGDDVILPEEAEPGDVAVDERGREHYRILAVSEDREEWIAFYVQYLLTGHRGYLSPRHDRQHLRIRRPPDRAGVPTGENWNLAVGDTVKARASRGHHSGVYHVDKRARDYVLTEVADRLSRFPGVHVKAGDVRIDVDLIQEVVSRASASAAVQEADVEMSDQELRRVIQMQQRAEELHAEISEINPDLADELSDREASIEELEAALEELRRVPA